MNKVERWKAPLVYEVHQHPTHPCEWLVGAVDHESEGEIYTALFSGPDAKERAEEYAAWKNSQRRSQNTQAS